MTPGIGLTEIYKPMKLTILIILLLINFVSCNVTDKLSSIKMIDGYNYFEQALPQVRIQLLGDYYFQPFRTKYFRDIDEKFIHYSTLRVGKARPLILYKAHTIVQPFYSTLCLQYKTNSADTVFLHAIKAQLKESLNITVSEVGKIKCGSRDVYKVKYQKSHSISRIYTSHTEYLFRNNEFIYRLFFWTANSDDTIISSEAESIIKEISFG